MKKAAIVFIPSPGAGHLVSAVEFARRLLLRDNTFSITILVMKLAFTPPPTTESKPTTSASPSTTTDSSDSSIRHIVLPDVEMPPTDYFKECPENFITAYIDAHKPHIRGAILNLLNSGPDSVPLAGLVVDMFCTSMIDIANEFSIPSYLFFTSSAAFLGLTLHLPAHYNQVGREFTVSDPESIIPSFKNPVPSSVIPTFAFIKAGYSTFLNHATRFGETKGIIVNTFAELEPHALNSFDGEIPPVYTVGPVLDLSGQAHAQLKTEQHDKIIRWLDAQPKSSVVFLCFGSVGSMREKQVREVGLGLIGSGTRFLWSLRKPLPEGKVGRPTDYTEDELKKIMPEEFFMLLNEGKGVVCGWAPQVEVLAHSAVCGFVSHCGWNSTLESLWFGKPIITWPMYAEQQTNAFELVRELGLAVELRLDYRLGSEDAVVADEIESAIRRLLEQENQVHKRVKDMSEMSKKALIEGGSSFTSLERLVNDIKGQHI
ncbi:hypothetical protein Ancab_028830 [Ancistrocladus abbreviatus]